VAPMTVSRARYTLAECRRRDTLSSSYLPIRFGSSITEPRGRRSYPPRNPFWKSVLRAGHLQIEDIGEGRAVGERHGLAARLPDHPIQAVSVAVGLPAVGVAKNWKTAHRRRRWRRRFPAARRTLPVSFTFWEAEPDQTKLIDVCLPRVAFKVWRSTLSARLSTPGGAVARRV